LKHTAPWRGGADGGKTVCDWGHNMIELKIVLMAMLIGILLLAVYRTAVRS
jgi:hypothetical protein